MYLRYVKKNIYIYIYIFIFFPFNNANNAPIKRRCFLILAELFFTVFYQGLVQCLLEDVGTPVTVAVLGLWA